MHTRMTIIAAQPEQIDRVVSVLQEQVLPQARQWDGSKASSASSTDEAVRTSP
jgi:hypothetical protein